MTFNLGEVLRAKLMMSELRDAMELKPKVEAPPERKPFQIGNNLNRTLFEQAQCYPTTRKNLTDRMVAMGFGMPSVSSILGQMIKQGILQADDEGVLHVTVAQYTPLKSSKTFKNMQKKQAAVPPRKKITFVRKGKGEERPVSSSPVPVAQPEGISYAQAVLRSVSLLQARELYDELKKIFGDNK